MARHLLRSHRTGWLRAGVLGANDGVLSVGSLVLGVAAARSFPYDVLVAAVAGLAAGILSVGAGEYVSVSSQADTERADLNMERQALRHEYRDAPSARCSAPRRDTARANRARTAHQQASVTVGLANEVDEVNH